MIDLCPFCESDDVTVLGLRSATTQPPYSDTVIYCNRCGREATVNDDWEVVA